VVDCSQAPGDLSHPATDLVVVVRGTNDVASAVAHRLFRAGVGVALHEDAEPTTSRRGMAFANAIFDSTAQIDGVVAVRA
jgi:xanthine dehydrogenase accessory factor